MPLPRDFLTGRPFRHPRAREVFPSELYEQVSVLINIVQPGGLHLYAQEILRSKLAR